MSNLYQGNSGNYGNWQKRRDEDEKNQRRIAEKQKKIEAKKNAPQKGFGFSLPKFPGLKMDADKIQAYGSKALVMAAGAAVVIFSIVKFAKPHGNAEPKILPFAQNKDSVSKKAASHQASVTQQPNLLNQDSLTNVAYWQEDARLHAAIAKDFHNEEVKLNKFYEARFKADSSSLQIKGDTSGLQNTTDWAAEFTLKDTKALFSTDSVRLTKKHPGIVFSLPDSVLMAVGTVQGKPDTVLATTLQYNF